MENSATSGGGRKKKILITSAVIVALVIALIIIMVLVLVLASSGDFSKVVRYNYSSIDGIKKSDDILPILGYAAKVASDGKVVQIKSEKICKFIIENKSTKAIKMDAYAIRPDGKGYSEYTVMILPKGAAAKNYLSADQIDGKIVPTFVGQTIHLLEHDGIGYTAISKIEPTLLYEKSLITVTDSGTGIAVSLTEYYD